MTTHHPNGASASRKPPKPTTERLLAEVELQITCLEAQLEVKRAKAAELGKMAAETDKTRCRVCGAFVAPSAPVDDKKTGGKKVRRRCYRDVGKTRVFCNAWWSVAEREEQKR